MEPLDTTSPPTRPFRKLGQKKTTVKRAPYKSGPRVAERDSVPDRLTLLKVLQDTQCIISGAAIDWYATKIKAKRDTELPTESGIALPFKLPFSDPLLQ
jgi:hypothetical protein